MFELSASDLAIDSGQQLDRPQIAAVVAQGSR
jgi:hypothetical protein